MLMLQRKSRTGRIRKGHRGRSADQNCNRRVAFGVEPWAESDTMQGTPAVIVTGVLEPPAGSRFSQ